MIQWLVKAVLEIELAANVQTIPQIAQEFTPSNVTESRTFDADTVTVAELADVLGTLLEDMQRGAKHEE